MTADREALGQRVREVWIRWAEQQPEPKPSWLVPWDDLAEPDREVDRLIGEELYAKGHSDGIADLVVEQMRAEGKTKSRLLIITMDTPLWVVYAHDHGPYAIALYASAGEASKHAARAGYGMVAEWPLGMEFADAIKAWEGR